MTVVEVEYYSYGRFQAKNDKNIGNITFSVKHTSIESVAGQRQDKNNDLYSVSTKSEAHKLFS